MKLLGSLVLIISVLVIGCSVKSPNNLQESFQNPPQWAYPHTWYHWMNGNVSKPGITKDLEALKEIGIAGFQLFDINWQVPFGGVEFNSNAYHSNIKYTIAEAERLGLEMGINSASGWSCTGGPWVEPENSMKMLVWSDTVVHGGMEKIMLSRPKLNKNQKLYNFYKDVAVLAFPTPADAEYRVGNWQEKSLNDLRAKPISFVPDSIEAPQNAVIKLKDIINITAHLNQEGKIDWDVPSGSWTILRMGYTTTGATLRPGSKGGEGLEIDKLSKKAAELHWNVLIDKVIEDAENKNALTTVLIDSYEVGNQNWTKGFENVFQERNGYNLIPHLLCATGRVVESTEYSDRVLWDMRKTVADMVHENFFGYFKEKCHQNNLLLACEPYGSGSFDAAEIAKMVDLPMTEFWHKDNPWKRRNLWDWTSQIVPSAAHLTGKKIVGAEAFTRMQGDWKAHPYRMKIWGDRSFTKGVNRYYFHSSVHQPWNDSVKPGNTMGMFGTQFHRNNTWFYKSKEWIKYIARCQYIFQQGDYVSDVLVLYGDERGYNSFLGNKEPLDMEFLSGLKFDLSEIETLNALKVNADKQIVAYHKGKELPNKYKVLLLKRADLMTVETASQLGQLAENGAVIFAPKPIRTPDLKDYAIEDKKLKELIEQYWNSGLIKTPGKFDAYLKTITLDCNMPDKLEYCHHKIEHDDFYFISNQSYNKREFKCSFRVNGKQPELWCPETGKISSPLSWRQKEDGTTEVMLNLTPAGSVFVVFRKPTKTIGENKPKLVSKQIKEIKNGWMVRFNPQFGPSQPVKFNSLQPWDRHKNEEVKYYSGTASYSTTFVLDQVDNQLFLYLGKVEVMAQVKLNGKDLGVLWKPPFKVDISSAVKKGKNELEVEVTNLWVNRLIGDAGCAPFEGRLGSPEKPGKSYRAYPTWLTEGKAIPEGSERKTFVAWHHYRNTNARLLPSGLLGPVVIEASIMP